MFLPTKACLRIRGRFTKLSGGSGEAAVPGLEERLRQLLSPLGEVPFLYSQRRDPDDSALLVDIGWYAASSNEGKKAARGLQTCFEAAASATGASVTLTEFMPYIEMHNDRALANAYRNNARALGRAREQHPQVREQIRMLSQLYPDAALKDVSLFLDRPPVDFPGGTDMGNVSQRVPAIHPFFGIGGLAFNHSVAFAHQANNEEAYSAMIDASTALAWTIVDVATVSASGTRLRGGTNPSSRRRT